jgi:signal peptidase I
MSSKVTVAERKSGGILETVKTLVYAVAIALFVRTFFFEPFNIPSGSMKPTLLIGDYLFVSKFSYGYSRHSLPFSLPLFEGRLLERLPERGDVAVFKLPADNRTDYIKRIVGLPGDRIQVIDGVLHVNDVAVRHEPLGAFGDEENGRTQTIRRIGETLPDGRSYEILDITTSGRFDNTQVFEVPPGKVFAMGDNRDNSLDSRDSSVGFVPIENLIGRAEILFFSIGPEASLWRPWTWPLAIRYERLLSRIR